jgi:hypothetical protein
MLPEDLLRGQVTQFADAEGGVEQRPDDEQLGGRHSRVSQPVGFLGGEGLPDVLVGHLSPKSCASGHERREGCAFRVPCYPGSGVRKRLFPEELKALGVAWSVEHTRPGCAFLCG